MIQIFLHSIACIALITFPCWHDEAPRGEAHPGHSFARAAQFASGAAALFGLISALWQHTAAVAAGSIMATTSYSYVSCHVGTAALILGWTPYFLLVLVFATILLLRYLQDVEDAEETGT
jgi:hypothetical protein